MNDLVPGAVSSGSRAVVVFSGHTDMPALRLLKPGFRHCCCLVEAQQYWIFYNPTSRGTEITVYDRLTMKNIVAWFLNDGHIVVCCRVKTPPPRTAPFRMFTCVEAVKRVLGVRAPWALTPWQFYKFLIGVA